MTRDRQISDRVERAPEERTADRGEARPPTGFGLLLQERRVEALSAADVQIVEVLVLVLERDVMVEPERAQVGEVLNLVGRVDPRGDGGQREHERRDEHGQLPSRQRQHS